MKTKVSSNLAILTLSFGAAFAVKCHAVAIDTTDTVKGRPPTATGMSIVNTSAPGLNPAVGDTLQGKYVYDDLDGTAEDSTKTEFSWSLDGTTTEVNTGDDLYTTSSEGIKKYVSFGVRPVSVEPSDPLMAPGFAFSQPLSAPILPSRTEFNSLYHFSSGANMRWGDAYMYCANRNERLMSIAELQELFVNYTRASTVPAAESNRDLNETYGVGLSNVAWSNQGNDTNHSYVYIQTDGHSSSNLNSGTVEVVCAKFGTPELLPSVTNVSFSNPVEGVEITPVYTYRGNATIPDRSRFEWKRANDQIGTGSVVVATTKNYTPVAEDVGKYLVVTIYPASYDTVVGNNVQPAGKIVKAQEQSFPAGTTLSVNGHTFGIDSGFPSTGFNSAKFQVQVGGTASNNGNYTWSTDQAWVAVDNSGNVTFTGTPNGSTKTFKIRTLSSDGNTSYSKSFTVNKWFLSGTGAGGSVSWTEASNYCSTRGGQPAISELTNAVSGTDGTRVTGKLWGEWGSLPTYSGSGFRYTGSSTSAFYWSSQSDSGDGPSNPSIADLGNRSYVTYNTSGAAVCRSNL
ncbi:hypothetical protein [Enterobacter mori]|uniref:hypothetical protein n=1 Tax=Enterobacter mori TaxID=539813 RepID=UPI002236BD67|nr:hypothetical protein [Enterobacter mori]MCW4989836.1 hypothetical protein [Enterobacter mori]